MKNREEHLIGQKGTRIFWQSWLPEDEPQADVAIVHGVGEHGGRYGQYVKALVSRGFALHALDHRGHGRSGGQRGAIDAWSDFRGDLQLFFRAVRGEGRKRPLFLLGHSMGG